MPDVFVPACVTPGTVALIVVHNHPSGDPTPSPDDVVLTKRLLLAAEVLGLTMLDHLILGEDGRYYSFSEARWCGTMPPARLATAVRGHTGPHHAANTEPDVPSSAHGSTEAAP
jgi:hypothetical protein